jgi:hypothetical protein
LLKELVINGTDSVNGSLIPSLYDDKSRYIIYPTTVVIDSTEAAAILIILFFLLFFMALNFIDLWLGY